MITLIEPPDDGGDGEFDDHGDFDFSESARGDDELTVLLRPGVSVLAPPPGTFQRIRRRAARRRLVRAVATAGAGAAVTATAITIALWPSGSAAGPGPVPPLGPAAGTSVHTPPPSTTTPATPVPSAPPSTPSHPSMPSQVLRPGPTSEPASSGATDVAPPRVSTSVPDPLGRTAVPSGAPFAQTVASDAPSNAPTTRLGTAATPTAIR